MMASTLRSGCARTLQGRPLGRRCSSHWRPSLLRPSPRQLSSAARAIQIAEHALYLQEVAVMSAPKHLPELLKVMEAQGHSLLSPSDRSGLHPLVIPLCSAPTSEAYLGDAPPSPTDASILGDSVVIGLLRWPNPGLHKTMGLPVVSMSRQAAGVKLLARSMDEYLHRLLVEEDAAGTWDKGQPLAAAAGAAGEEVYRPGAFLNSDMKMQMYLIRKAGMYPDVCESLARGHLARGDVTSALVASEWYMRAGHFSGWGRPYEFAAELFQQVGKREEEARDMARFALRNPWWSLASFSAMRDACAIAGSPSDIKYALSEEAASAATSAVTKFNYAEEKPPQQIAMEKAAELMDLVAAGEIEGGYEAVREQLASSYREAGLSDVANFILAA